MELRLVNADELRGILQRLEEHLPESSGVYNYLNVGLTCGFQTNISSDAEVYVPNDPNDRSSFVLITAIMTARPFPTFTVYWKDGELTNHDLTKLLLSLPFWNCERPLFVGTTPTGLTLQIENVLQEQCLVNNLKPFAINILSSCGWYTYEHSDHKCKSFRLHPEYEIRCLTQDNIRYALHNWHIDWAHSPEITYNVCRNLGSIGIFKKHNFPKTSGDVLSQDKDQPVSWVLHHRDGAVGFTVTMPEHRRRGLAIYATDMLLKQITDQGKIPFVLIDPRRLKSIEMHEKLGFTKKITHVEFRLYIPNGMTYTNADAPYFVQN